MHQITDAQIQVVLTTFYETNISAKSFDAVKKFMLELPKIKESRKEKEPTIPELPNNTP